METYYHPPDLGKFGEMGQASPELWNKFLAWYNAVFAEGALLGIGSLEGGILQPDKVVPLEESA